jgi:CheY-like chemotaxis protein
MTGRRSVLVIDDDDSVRGLAVKSLDRAGWAVVAAENGDQGLDRLGEQAFDVVLTDYMMPGTHGVELVRRIKEVRPKVRVVVMTGSGILDEEVFSLYEVGMDRLVKKPFTPKELSDAVETVLDERAPDPA